jgi:hypothetical protein
MVTPHSQSLDVLENCLPGLVRTMDYPSSSVCDPSSSMVITGVAVLLGTTHIKDPYANFHDLFNGSTSNPNAIATSLVSVTCSYQSILISYR